MSSRLSRLTGHAFHEAQWDKLRERVLREDRWMHVYCEPEKAAQRWEVRVAEGDAQTFAGERLRIIGRGMTLEEAGHKAMLEWEEHDAGA